MAGFALSDVPIKRATSPRRWFWIALATPPVALIVALLALGRGSVTVAALGFLCVIDALVFFLLPALLPERREKRVRLRADASGVFASGRCILPRAAIASAAIERPLAGTPRVVFFDRSARAELEVGVPDDVRGKALIRALGLDAEQSTASFVVDRAPLMQPAGRLREFGARAFGGIALFLATLGLMKRCENDWILVGYPPSLLVFLVAVERSRRSVRVVIGSDAIVVRAGTAEPRIIAHGTVERVRKARGGVELVLQGGEVVPLHVSTRGEAAESHRAALEARAFEVLEIHAFRGDARGAESTQLSRDGRPAEVWVRDVRAFASGDASSYRENAASGERLWRILEDPAADSTARVGAAIALAPSLDEEGKQRVRAVARASALPSVRVALEAAADAEDDETLCASLDDPTKAAKLRGRRS